MPGREWRGPKGVVVILQDLALAPVNPSLPALVGPESGWVVGVHEGRIAYVGPGRAAPGDVDTAASKPLAWRNAWEIPELTAKADAAVLERDTEKRAQMYREMQEEVLKTSPFVIMFQESEVVAMRKNVEGYVIGPSFNDNSFAAVTK